MKIRSVRANSRRKAFEVTISGQLLVFPYAKASPRPTATDPVETCCADPELGREAFTYALASGIEGTIHIDQVREYNQDPAYLREALLYSMKIEAQRRVAASPLSKREIIRRLGTSATQFYRLLDQTNTRTSLDRLLDLLHILDCEVRMSVRVRSPRRSPIAT